MKLALTVFALLLATAGRADAATFLGSLDPSAPPDSFACATCPAGASFGFRQFALRGTTVEAVEDGVLVSASVQARRLAGTEDPRIAVLRPDDDGVNLHVVASAPVPLTDDVSTADELHLPVQRGDSIGFLLRAGEVDLGVKARPRPDGAIQWFGTPCDPCGMDGGTGSELLMQATVEPDVDHDGMGDETQDSDGGGIGEDWQDQWFSDYDSGDELDAEDFGDESTDRGQGRPHARRRHHRPRSLGLLAANRHTLLIAVPKPGKVSVSVTLPANRRTGAGPFTTIATGTRRVRHAGRIHLHLAGTPSGARVLARHPRTKVVVAYFPRRTTLEILMRSARL
jgi:hypothetical protein